MNKVERIIDANQNRCVEGLRVLEDYSRFIRDDNDMSSQIRSLRHFIRKSLGQRWISHRDSGKDVGKRVSASNQLDQKVGIAQLLRANCSRVAESLRVLEEYLKVLGQYDLSKAVEAKRFDFYQIEKKLVMAYNVRGLYALTSDGTEEEVLAQVQRFIDHKVPWIQYRDKHRDQKSIELISHKVVELAKGTQSRIIINDYPDIAMAVGADGVHVGQDDLSVQEVRRIAPELLVGVSTHNQQQFDGAVSMSPDYIALGPIFETTTKVNPEPCEGLSFAEYARQSTQIPLVAIGGINTTNLSQIMSVGVDSIAMTAAIKEAKQLKTIQTKILQTMIGE